MNVDTVVLMLFAFLAAWVLGYLLWLIVPALSGLPWIPTREVRIRKALQLARVSPDDIVYDLGSGDGRVLVVAAREFGARAVGIEISPLHCIAARINAFLAGINGRVTIQWASFYKVNFTDADVVFVYMTARETSRLRPYLEKQLRPGTRIITVSCEIPGWQPVIFDREALIFIYQLGPSPVSG